MICDRVLGGMSYDMNTSKRYRQRQPSRGLHKDIASAATLARARDPEAMVLIGLKYDYSICNTR